MPSLLTHQFFATRFIEAFKHEFPFLLDHYSVVTLGAQGPDPLFFYGHAPFSKRPNTKKVNHLGNLLHAEPKHLLDLMSTMNHDLTKVELSYLLGALTHYVLDRTVHPYVFYHTGFDQKGELVPPFQGAHAKFEVTFDVAVKQHYALDEKLYHPAVTLGISDDVFPILDAFYLKAYPSLIEKGMFENAIKDMQATYSFLYHASFFKQAFVRLLTGKQSLPFNLIHPKMIKKDLEDSLLNLKHTSYQHPVTGKTATHNFDELMNIALDDMRVLVQLIFSADPIATKTSRFVDFIKNIDYDGKKVGSTMKFFKPFFKGF
jgi:hypothetical protein